MRIGCSGHIYERPAFRAVCKSVFSWLISTFFNPFECETIRLVSFNPLSRRTRVRCIDFLTPYIPATLPTARAPIVFTTTFGRASQNPVAERSSGVSCIGNCHQLARPRQVAVWYFSAETCARYDFMVFDNSRSVLISQHLCPARRNFSLNTI